MTKMTTCDLHNETIIRLQKRIAELEARVAELANTVGLLNVSRSKAETSLRECMAHADAMQAFIDDEEGGTTITLAYSQWKEGQHERHAEDGQG